MSKLIDNLQNDASGTIAIVFAFTFIILVGVVGGAVDYGRWNSARFATQDAIDAAVLAGGRALQLPNKTHADALAAAQQYFDQNKPVSLEPVNVTFAIDANGTELSGNTTTSAVKNAFLRRVRYPRNAGQPDLKVQPCYEQQQWLRRRVVYDARRYGFNVRSEDPRPPVS